jgi:hypothetical protein
MMRTEPGGLVETSDDGTLVLAGEGHFANVQVPEKVNPLLASARGIPKDLVPHR